MAGNFTPITLNTKVYGVDTIREGRAYWSNQDSGVPTGFSPASIKVTSPTGKGQNYHVHGRIVVPVVSSDDSACVCEGEFLRQSAVEINFVLSSKSSLAERQDILARLKDFVATTQFKTAVENLSSVSW